MSSSSPNSGQSDHPPVYKAPAYSARPQYVEYVDKPRKYQSRASIVMESFKSSRSNSINASSSSGANGPDATSAHGKSKQFSSMTRLEFASH